MELLIPTLFSIALVIQLHFFHKPLTMKINHLLILRKQAKDRRLVPAELHENSENREPDSSETQQQPETVAPEAVTAATKSDSEQDTEVTEGEMTALHKFLCFYKNASKVLWHVAEIHAIKILSFVIMLVVVQQVIAA